MTIISPPDQREIAFYNGRRVLITGGFGFLGRNLVKHLVRAGADVTVLSRTAPTLTPDLASVVSKVTHHRGDMRNAESTELAVAGVSTIFNLAGRSGATASNAEPMEDLDVNGYGQLTLLEVCRRINRTARVVFSSSRLVYGPTDRLPVNEDAGLSPLSVYGTHKLLGECYHRVYARVHGISTVILRITNPYGPHQDDDRTYGIVNMFIRTALAGRPLTVFGDGGQLRDFVHVDDVIRAFLLAGMTDSANGEAINIGGGQAVRFKDMAEEVVRITGCGRVEYEAWPDDAAAAETGSFVASIEAAAQRLGWRPQIEFAAGLESAIRCYQEGLTR